MILANLLGALEGPELLIILALVTLLFGGKKLPELARSLGQAKREFHEGVGAGESKPAATEPAALTEAGDTPTAG